MRERPLPHCFEPQVAKCLPVAPNTARTWRQGLLYKKVRNMCIKALSSLLAPKGPGSYIASKYLMYKGGRIGYEGR